MGPEVQRAIPLHPLSPIDNESVLQEIARCPNPDQLLCKIAVAIVDIADHGGRQVLIVLGSRKSMHRSMLSGACNAVGFGEGLASAKILSYGGGFFSWDSSKREVSIGGSSMTLGNRSIPESLIPAISKALKEKIESFQLV